MWRASVGLMLAGATLICAQIARRAFTFSGMMPRMYWLITA